MCDVPKTNIYSNIKITWKEQKKRETKPNTHLQVPQFAPVACLFDQLVIAFESYNDSLLQPIQKKKQPMCHPMISLYP